MTKKERVKIRLAMTYIHSDETEGGDYDAGMRILAKLAGIKTKPEIVTHRIELKKYLRGMDKKSRRGEGGRG